MATAVYLLLGDNQLATLSRDSRPSAGRVRVCQGSRVSSVGRTGSLQNDKMPVVLVGIPEIIWGAETNMFIIYIFFLQTSLLQIYFSYFSSFGLVV